MEHKLETYACLPQAPLLVTPKIDYVDPSVTPLSTQNYTVTLNTSLTRPTTRWPSQHLAKPFRLKHKTSLNTPRVLQHQEQIISKAANKELSLLCVCC